MWDPFKIVFENIPQNGIIPCYLLILLETSWSLCFYWSPTVWNLPWPVSQPSEEGAAENHCPGDAMGSRTGVSICQTNGNLAVCFWLKPIKLFTVPAAFSLLSQLIEFSPKREVMSTPNILRQFSIKKSTRQACNAKRPQRGALFHMA